ncbi:MAG TPA: DUF6551 family protein [Stellaceae bacterium]|nr:DUF6551 family protein [Stellaceae bacterium]
MGERRPIDPSGFAPLEEGFEPGPAPMLQWIAIADLVVDETYQRPIVGAGRTNVRRIAQNFRWSMFAPVIVAPIEGGKYAIVDGQHRTTAAALRGIETIPCQVVIADGPQQAAAFKAINGQVTAMNSLSLHRAALAAGDPEAAQIDAAARAAGVVILGYPKGQADLQPGETMALGVIRAALKAFERETVIAALRCITATSNNRPGAVNARVIQALVAVIGKHGAWRGERLIAAVDRIDLNRELGKAEGTEREPGMPVWRVLADRLTARLGELIDGRKPTQAAIGGGQPLARPAEPRREPPADDARGRLAQEAAFVREKRGKGVPWAHIAQQLVVPVLDLRRRHDPEFRE